MVLIVDVVRGPVVESRHEVDMVVVDADGVRHVWGDGERGVLARSSLKPIQAVPLIETGAADVFVEQGLVEGGFVDEFAAGDVD